MKKKIIGAILSALLILSCMGGAAGAANTPRTTTVDVHFDRPSRWSNGVEYSYNAIVSFEITNVLEAKDFTLEYESGPWVTGNAFAKSDKIVAQSPCVITYKGVKEARGLEEVTNSPLWIDQLNVTPELFKELTDKKVGESGAYYDSEKGEWVNVIDGLMWDYTGWFENTIALEPGKSVTLQKGYYILGLNQMGGVDFGYIEVKDGGAPVTNPAAGISVVLDGQQLVFDVPPQAMNGRTLVPLRTIFEALGATIEWDNATKTVTAEKGDTVIVLTIGSTSPTVNGKIVPIDQPGIIVDGRTLVPLRFVGEALGVKVDWDGPTNTVTITSS